MKKISLKINIALLTIGLAFGAKSFGQQSSGQALIEAITKGDVAQVNKLIAAGANVNAQGQEGYTPLENAVGYNNPELVKILLAAKATVNVPEDEEGAFTPLTIAAGIGNSEIVKMLLDK